MKEQKREGLIKKYKWLIIALIIVVLGTSVYQYKNRNIIEEDKKSVVLTDIDGEKEEKQEDKNEILDEKVTKLYDSGKILSEINWKWQENKEKIQGSEEDIEIGIGNERIFYEDGKLFGEGEVKAYNFSQFNFRPDKKWKYYYKNGALMLEGEYTLKWQTDEDGIRMENWDHIGEWNYYYEDGKNIKVKAHYNNDDDRINSYWEFFDINGNLEKVIEIQGDRKNGVVVGEENDSIKYKIKYYKNGNIINEEELVHNMSDTKIMGFIGDLIEFNILPTDVNILDEKNIKEHLNIKE